MSVGGGVPIVREAVLADADEIQKLTEKVGMPVRPGLDWPRFWRDNPVWPSTSQEPRIGWALETHGQIVGVVGSIPQQFQYGDQKLIGATAAWYAVHPQYRGYGLALTAEFFKQKKIRADFESQVFLRHGIAWDFKSV